MGIEQRHLGQLQPQCRSATVIPGGHQLSSRKPKQLGDTTIDLHLKGMIALEVGV